MMVPSSKSDHAGIAKADMRLLLPPRRLRCECTLNESSLPSFACVAYVTTEELNDRYLGSVSVLLT